LQLLYIATVGSYTNFRPKNSSKGGAAMDLKAVGQRIKMAREAKGLTQEDLAAMVELSPTHVSVIERGLKAAKLDTFVAIANALEVSADSLLIDVVAHSVTGVTNELSEMIGKLPKEEQKKIIKAVRALTE
jgi:XRE family transcriptional regulator